MGQYSRDKENYVYLAFHELFESVKVFSSGLKKLLQDKNCSHSMISMCSVPRLEWYLTDLTCLFLNVPTVSLLSFALLNNVEMLYLFLGPLRL